MAVDVDLLRNEVLRNASFGGVPFFMERYTVTTGRHITTTEMYTYGSRSNAPGTGGRSGVGGSGRRSLQERAANDALAQKYAEQIAARTPVEPKATKSQTKIDATTEIEDAGPHPVVDDQGMIPNTILARIYFLNKGNAVDGLTPYTEDRDRFLEKVAEGQPLELQLNTYKPFLALAGEARTMYEKDKGGIEYIEVEFYKYTSENISNLNATARVQGSPVEVTSAANNTNNNAVDTTAEALTQTNLDVDTWTYDLQEEANEATVSALRSLSDDIGNVVSGVMTVVDEYALRVTAISNDIGRLLYQPVQLAERVASTLQSLESAILNPIDKFNYMTTKVTSLIGDMKDSIDNVTDSQSYRLAILSQTVGFAYCSGAQAITQTDLLNTELVDNTKEELTTTLEVAINTLSEVSGLESMLTDMQNVYASVMTYLDSLENVPEVREITTGENLPLIVTAYNLYGDATMVEELDTMNTPHNRLTPQQDLKVIYDPNAR